MGQTSTLDVGHIYGQLGTFTGAQFLLNLFSSCLPPTFLEEENGL